MIYSANVAVLMRALRDFCLCSSQAVLSPFSGFFVPSLSPLFSVMSVFVIVCL